MYNIGIPEIRITNCYENTDGLSIIYDAEALTRPSICPNTKVEHDGNGFHLHFHSSKQNLLKDIRLKEKLVYINLTIKRYRCAECGTIITDRFTFYNKHSHITNRLRDEFVRRCIKGESFNCIARDYGVDHKTVSAAFRAYSDSRI